MVQVYGRATICPNTRDALTGWGFYDIWAILARLGEEGLMGFQDVSGLGSGSDVEHGDGSGSGDEDGNPPHSQSPDLERVKTAVTGAGGYGDDTWANCSCAIRSML
ncbi:hypothetical protein PDIG_02560 [Penicillium digitatum PHI26]|uniref:Uncharacterized protein n=2 Tax=Penicillium digitatum TaxID=36651 RepID=K9GEA6_PEND2|nr:hypothetical protein PDIP_13840 [Penicillium digitatum Pd1]EKV19527.1 hypothetical protein PDIG_02560 [Penicillium digitatum PHI26]EKV20703.1 hypothetical protein PDIP_13840 [Penicillium digitatum Pd1]